MGAHQWALARSAGRVRALSEEVTCELRFDTAGKGPASMEPTVGEQEGTGQERGERWDHVVAGEVGGAISG